MQHTTNKRLTNKTARAFTKKYNDILARIAEKQTTYEV
jgi:hypothetical protein